MTKPKELTRQTASTQALVRQFRSSIAVSPKDVQRGQVVFLDRHGRAVGRKGFGRVVTAYRIANYGALVGAVALTFAGFPIVGGAIYLAVIARQWRIRRRGAFKLMTIEMLSRDGKLDEAQRQLDEVPELRRRNPAMYCRIAGSMASHRGDYAKALEWWHEALPHTTGVEQALLKVAMTKALVRSERVKEARLMMESVAFPAGSDETLSGRGFMRVMLALSDPSATPLSDDDLHELTRQALEYSHTGPELAALGWLFDRAGDQDMAQLLATEARERMHYPYLATWWPELQQWLDGRASTAPDQAE